MEHGNEVYDNDLPNFCCASEKASRPCLNHCSSVYHPTVNEHKLYSKRLAL